MFTGLVEALGQVAQVTPQAHGVDLHLAVPWGNEAGVIGESIALNGCCLTLVSVDREGWLFQAGEETLSRTNLGQLQPGDVVNLERSLRAGDRLGGHFVQGHIDGQGQVSVVDRTGDWVRMIFAAPSQLTRQMVSKGSVAVDGVSLTLVDVGIEQFSVALIPHTLEVTTLGRRRVGDAVNLETDILGKYLDKMWRLAVTDGVAQTTVRSPWSGGDV